MCGIVCAYNENIEMEGRRTQLLSMSKQIRHRGPDWSGIYVDNDAILAHERLAIVDPVSGGQPLFSQNKKLVLAVNGEIYNHGALRQLTSNYDYQTGSDCEVILGLYQSEGMAFVDKLNGIFAFVLYDADQNLFFAARDHMGIIPLYMGWDAQGTLYFASELKALEGQCNKIEVFPPGRFYDGKQQKLIKWYDRSWRDFEAVKERETDIEQLREALESAVHRQLMSDVPYGVLLSGGLDSSITSALAKKFAKKRVESNDISDAWWPQLHSFSIGLKGSPDLKAAQLVADHIGTVHHEVTFTVQEMPSKT
jgi:asparagine synthase (glutamine-hydrolysing)